MARPWKHPQSGIYWFRKRVPEDLRVALGKTEEKQILGTRDPTEAKRLHAELLLKVEERWANARKGPRELSWSEAQTIAGEVYRWQIDRYADDPFKQRDWSLDIGAMLFPEPGSRWLQGDGTFDLGSIDPTLTSRLKMERWCQEAADRLLAQQGALVGDDSRRRLAKAVSLAMQQAGEELKQMEKGSFSARQHLPSRSDPKVIARAPRFSADGTVATFDALIVGWAAEKSPGNRTLYNWRRVARQLVEFLGQEDAASITADDLLRWKSHLIESGLSAKTVRDSKLAPMRAILQWGVDNRRLVTNPAERITMGVKAKAGQGRRGFTDCGSARIFDADRRGNLLGIRASASSSCIADLHLSGYRTYLLARSVWAARNDPRTGPTLWRLDRMSAVELLDEPSTVPKCFSLDEYAKRSFGVFQRDEEYGEVVDRRRASTPTGLVNY